MKKIRNFLLIAFMTNAFSSANFSSESIDISKISNISRPANSEQEHQFAQEVLLETNKFRASYNLKPLILDMASLGAYADLRAEEASRSFSHVRPNNQKFSDNVFTHINKNEAFTVGENLYEVKGLVKQIDPKHVVKKWIDSPSHRKNLLGNFTQMGVGYHRNGVNQYASQVFATNAKTIYKFAPEFKDEDLRNILQYHRQTQILNLRNERKIIIHATNHSGVAQLIEKFTPLAYASFGIPFLPNENFKTVFKGTITGDLGQREAVTGDFSAIINDNKLTLSVKCRTNTDLLTQEAVAISHDVSFKDLLIWNSITQRYESKTGSARIYGNGSEFIGLFDHTTKYGQFRGVYRAIKP